MSGRPRIWGGVQRSQAQGLFDLYIGSEHTLASVYGTLEELRAVLKDMAEGLERYETPARPAAAPSDGGAG